MKKYLIQIFCIVSILLFYFSPIIAYGSFKEVWKGNFESTINKLLSVDTNKNAIKEILVLSGEKKLKLLECDKNTFVIKWQPPEFKAGVDFEFYDFTDSLWIKEFNPIYSQEQERLFKCRMSLLRSFPPKLDEPNFGKYDALAKEKCGEINAKIKPYNFHTLLYDNGKYLLKELKLSPIPSWPNETYVTSGSFKDRNIKDIILTTYCIDRKCYLRFRDTKNINSILWTSNFSVAWTADLPMLNALPLFGDFDGDKEIELIVIPYNENKGYWISRVFVVKEIKSYRKSINNNVLPLFPLYNSYNGRNFKVGRTTSKDFDGVFFIEPAEVLYSGGLFKATWNNDRFEFKDILYGLHGLDNLSVADIDNDRFDEIIVSEVRGDLIKTEEEPYVENRRDVVHILKWSGKEYKDIWTSQALGTITQVLVDDVTGDGKKEIIVGNDKGEIYIFGQE